MSAWLEVIIWIVATIVLATLAGLFGRQLMRGARTGLGLGLIMLGFGPVYDPPAMQAMEAVENERDDADTPSGDPDET